MTQQQKEIAVNQEIRRLRLPIECNYQADRNEFCIGQGDAPEGWETFPGTASAERMAKYVRSLRTYYMSDELA